jgi:hypothetical protein
VGEGADQERLPQSGHALQEHVSAGEQGCGDFGERVGVPDHDPFHGGSQALRLLSEVGNAIRQVRGHG